MASDDDDREDLPAFQRSKQISEIFTGVQSMLPDMEFSEVESDEENDDVPVGIVDNKLCYRPFESVCPVLIHPYNMNTHRLINSITNW